jgi:Fuc2NAc and GlcNAc transferase
VVALVGFIDDVRSLSPGLRLATHFAAAAWTLTFLNGFPSISVGDLTLPLGPAGVILAGFGLVWATNLFNFMDGIDGIAGVETLSVAGVGGLLLLRTGNLGLGLLALVLAGSALGFLRWNWPPAQIFLGDVGSGFIGFMLAALAIASENSNAVPVLVWAILFAAFIVDATITLVRRFRGRLWREAHKTHAYQRAVQAGGKHASVTSAIVAVNLLLALLAFGAVSGAIGVQVALVLAFAVCVTIYWGVERVRPLRLKDLDDSTAGVDDRSLTASLDDTPLAVRNSQDKSR